VLKLLGVIEKIDSDYQYRLDKDVKVESKANGSIVFRWQERERPVSSIDSEGLMTFEIVSDLTGLWCSPDRLITVELVEGLWVATLYDSKRDYNNTLERWKQFNRVRDIRKFLAA
jgi:hypothetical protein